MLLVLHILIALASVAYTSYLFFAPTKRHFYTAYGLVGLTLGSGTILVVSTHSPLLSSCVTGLVYISVVLTAITAAHRRLATGQIRIKKD